MILSLSKTHSEKVGAQSQISYQKSMLFSFNSDCFGFLIL